MAWCRRFAALALLAALVATLGGRAGYNDAVRDVNKSRDEHPRVAKVKLTPVDPSKPAQVVNGVLEAEIPLDA